LDRHGGRAQHRDQHGGLCIGRRVRAIDLCTEHQHLHVVCSAMSERSMRYPAHSRAGQQGYSVVELSVALVIALFLLTGLFSILQGTRKTSTNQSALAQLQDNERIAAMVMNDVIQEAGYYPNAANTLPTAAFLPTTAFAAAGQTVVGGANPN